MKTKVYDVISTVPLQFGPFTIIRVAEPTVEGRLQVVQSLAKIKKELEAALADVLLAEQRQDWDLSYNQRGLTVLEDEAEKLKIRLAMLIDSERGKDIDIDGI